MLQVMYISPHAHDIHQIVEHTIGVIKRGARKELRQAASEQPLSADEYCTITYSAIHAISKSLEAKSITHGLFGMRNALVQIAAQRDVDIVLHDSRRGMTWRTKGTGGGYASLL